MGTSQQECEGKGCCWAPAQFDGAPHVDLPWCFTPNAAPSEYRATRVEEAAGAWCCGRLALRGGCDVVGSAAQQGPCGRRVLNATSSLPACTLCLPFRACRRCGCRAGVKARHAARAWARRSGELAASSLAGCTCTFVRAIRPSHAVPSVPASHNGPEYSSVAPSDLLSHAFTSPGCFGGPAGAAAGPDSSRPGHPAGQADRPPLAALGGPALAVQVAAAQRQGRRRRLPCTSARTRRRRRRQHEADLAGWRHPSGAQGGALWPGSVPRRPRPARLGRRQRRHAVQHDRHPAGVQGKLGGPPPCPTARHARAPRQWRPGSLPALPEQLPAADLEPQPAVGARRISTWSCSRG